MPQTIKTSHGYTSNELQTLIGKEFPDIKPRKFLVDGKWIPEWKPSKYFRSIPMADDDGGADDILFYGPTTNVYHTCATSESNMKRAFLKRMVFGGKCMIHNDHQDNTYNKRLEIRKFLDEVFIPKYITPLKPGLTFESALRDWMDHCKRYTLKKKNALYTLLQEMLKGGYEAKYHGVNDPMGLRVINVFQKSENYPEVKEPRAISACSQECKALLGGFLHAIDKHAIATTPFFVKGMNPWTIDEKVKQMSSRWSLYMGSDYSSYEGSQDYQWVNLIEKRIYEEWLKNYPEVWNYLKQIYEEGHDIYYKKRYFGHINGKRMSGDVQTSIGNGISNAVIWSYVSYKMNIPIEFLVEGDDAFICSDSPLDVNIVRDLGFDCKIDGPSFNYEDICFLSRYKWQGNVFGNIPKIIDKIGVVKSRHFTKRFKDGSNRSMREIEDYAYTKAYCFLFMYTGTPIIDPLCRAIMRLSNGHFNIGLMEDHYFERLGDNFKIKPKPIKMCVRRRVAELWPQFPVAYQLELEAQLNNLDNYNCLIEF